MSKRYLIVVFGDVEPTLRGPFKTDNTRLAAARRYRCEEGDEDGLFMLDIDAKGRPKIGAFGGGDLE